MGLERIWRRQRDSTYRLWILVPETEVLRFECDLTTLRWDEVRWITSLYDWLDIGPVVTWHGFEQEKD